MHSASLSVTMNFGKRLESAARTGSSHHLSQEWETIFSK